MIKEAISKVVNRHNLSMSQTEDVMNEIMSGQATPAQIASFITALRIKGETAEEIAGCARIMQQNALHVNPQRLDVVDTCGTGGDATGTFNISTTVAFVAAGAGLGVAKHGNRSVSSQCGSADLMETLGIKIDLKPEQVARCVDEVGIGFCFAPLFHPAMKYATPVRQEIALRTVFNVLGPLANPARAKRQLVGVYAEELTEILADVLHMLKSERAFVVHGADGLDELSTTGINRVSELCDGQVITYKLDPAEYGLMKASLKDLAGGTVQENAGITREILSGEGGPRRDIVLLNAAVVLLAGDKAQDIKEGLEIAAESIDSGAAFKKIEELAHLSQRLG